MKSVNRGMKDSQLFYLLQSGRTWGADAQNSLAVMYAVGEGVCKQLGWFSKAADSVALPNALSSLALKSHKHHVHTIRFTVIACKTEFTNLNR